MKATSTVWVDSNGNLVPNPDHRTSDHKRAVIRISLIVCLTVGLALIAAAILGIWVCRRRRQHLDEPQIIAQDKEVVEGSRPNEPENRIVRDRVEVQGSAVARPGELAGEVAQTNHTTQNRVDELPAVSRPPELLGSPARAGGHS